MMSIWILVNSKIIDSNLLINVRNKAENSLKDNKFGKEFFTGVNNNKVISESVTRLNPYYLAKFNPVMRFDTDGNHQR